MEVKSYNAQEQGPKAIPLFDSSARILIQTAFLVQSRAGRRLTGRLATSRRRFCLPCTLVGLRGLESASVESRPGHVDGRLSQSARVVLPGLGGVSLRPR